jgi:hypothetical protein
MSHLSLVFASKSHGLSGVCLASGEREFARAEATAFPTFQPSIRAIEASWTEDSTLPAGIASMEHWLDLNA